MSDPLDTSWIDDWFPSVDGIRAKSVREKAKREIPAFIQKKIDAKEKDGGDSEGEDATDEKAKKPKK